jgi:hypothetical protein
MQGTEYFDGSNTSSGEPNQINLWLEAMEAAVDMAKELTDIGTTKQLVNRILEPYQWYTCIVTATEYDNFFELRCPQYFIETSDSKMPVFKSKKDAKDYCKSVATDSMTDLDWLKCNTGQGEIHISLLAEAMWDAMNESKPKQLKAGEWHIPFGENLDRGLMGQYVPDFSTAPSEMTNMFNAEVDKIAIKIATARCARVSYLNFEGKDDYEADIKLYDRLKDMGHMSPFEHCARAMSEEEYDSHIKGVGEPVFNSESISYQFYSKELGWSGNFRGFVQLRKEIE